MTSAIEPTPSPAQQDFQFTWPDPEYAKMHWFWDQMHHPHPVTAMTKSIDGRAFSNGIGKAMRTLQMPTSTMLTETMNGYWFHTQVPVTTDPVERSEEHTSELQ